MVLTTVVVTRWEEGSIGCVSSNARKVGRRVISCLEVWTAVVEIQNKMNLFWAQYYRTECKSMGV